MSRPLLWRNMDMRQFIRFISCSFTLFPAQPLYREKWPFFTNRIEWFSFLLDSYRRLGMCQDVIPPLGRAPAMFGGVISLHPFPTRTPGSFLTLFFKEVTFYFCVLLLWSLCVLLVERGNLFSNAKFNFHALTAGRRLSLLAS